jgi:hypothetical protein
MEVEGESGGCMEERSFSLEARSTTKGYKWKDEAVGEEDTAK